MTIKADDILASARSYIGVPFQHQGRSRQCLDCVGLLLKVADDLTVPYTDVEGYTRRPWGGLLEQTFDDHVASGQLVKVEPSQRQKGDFLMMRFKGQPQHLAVFTGENIIHAYEAVGKVCEHRLDEMWASRIVRVYRLKGVDL